MNCMEVTDVTHRRIHDPGLVDKIEVALGAGLRPEELAARAHISVSTLYWVRRAAVMSQATAQKLTAALAVAEGRP